MHSVYVIDKEVTNKQSKKMEVVEVNLPWDGYEIPEGMVEEPTNDDNDWDNRGKSMETEKKTF